MGNGKNNSIITAIFTHSNAHSLKKVMGDTHAAPLV